MARFGFILILTGFLMTALGSLPAVADGVPVPTLAKPLGEQCVEPKDFMRRNHMDLLKHQRDETMREGIRGKKYSWKGCVECHAATHPKIAEGKIRTLYPFCAQCHHYAAVKIDCVSCHSPVAQGNEPMKFSTMEEEEAQKLLSMMKGHLGEEASQ